MSTTSRFECKSCHHSIRSDAQGNAQHIGRRSSDCLCDCRGKPWEEVPYRELGTAKRPRRIAGEAPPVTAAPEPSPPAVLPPEESTPEPVAPPVVVSAPTLIVTPLTRYFSNSEVRTWKRCKRKWWLGTYRRLRPIDQPVTGHAPLGTRVHAALAGMYSTTPRNPLEILDEIAARELVDYPEQAEDIAKEHELATIMVQGYLEHAATEGLDEGLEIVADEAVIETELLPNVKLRGKLDVRVRRIVDGVRLFMDHKTVGTIAEPIKTLHMDEQMLTYQLLEHTQPQDHDGDYAAGGLYNMLRKIKRTGNAKPPFYYRAEVRHNVYELRNFWNRIVGTVTDILTTQRKLDEGGDHQALTPPNPRRDCSWDCEFFSICTLFDDGSRIDDLIVNLYTEGDPNERYAEKETTL